MEQKRPRILIAVPTCKRPRMLGRCLDALGRIRLPERTECSLLVADNDSEESAREVVMRFAARAPFPVAYSVEPERGLSSIRNHIIEHALAKRADCIASVDDDGTVYENWLTELYATLRETNAHAVSPLFTNINNAPPPPRGHRENTPKTQPARGLQQGRSSSRAISTRIWDSASTRF